MSLKSKESMKAFDKRLKKMEPLDKSDIKVDLITSIETNDDLSQIYDLNSIWKSIDSEVKTKCIFPFSQTLYAIFKIRFLIPISELKINYMNIIKEKKNEILGKILITDNRSYGLLQDIIDMKC